MRFHELKLCGTIGKRTLAVALQALWLLVLFVSPHRSVAASLDPSKAITQYTRQFWGTDAGLPQQSVTALAQTPDGFLWLGTEDGLVRFDGAQFVVFDKNNTPELRSSIINALQVDKVGTLWIGTRGGGLASYWKGKITSFKLSPELTDSSVSVLYQDNAGSLWIGTDDSGLFRFAAGRVVHYGKAQELASNSIFALTSDSQGLWIGTDTGLCQLIRDHFACRSKADGLPGNQIRALQSEKDGELWVGTDQGLAHLVNGKSQQESAQGERLPKSSITSLYRDRSGTLWIGTLEAGLIRLAEGHFQSFSKRDGLAGTGIWSILEDREGNLWLGGIDGGLGCLREGLFTPFSRQEGLASDTVTAVFESRDHTVWLGSDAGLTGIKEGHFSRYTTREGLPDNLVLSLTQDQQGDLWVGTRTGLARMLNGTLHRVGLREGFLGTGSVLSLYTDRQGDVWVGTRGKLSRFDGAHFTTYGAAEGFPSSLIIAIHQSSDGTLWIGTDGGGLLSFTNNRFHRYTTLDGLPSNAVWAITGDVDGSLWLGTNGGGLVRFHNGRFHAFQRKDGLSDDVVFQILDDQRGRLWMSSNKGVFSVAKRNLLAFAERRAESVQSTLYGPADGIRARECNGGFQPAGWRASDGKLWFPTTLGAVTVNPSNLDLGPKPPSPVLETVFTGKYRLPLSQDVILPSGTKHIELRFTVPYFRAPERLQFRYQLENFDKEWISADSRRVAYYTNVPPGEYRFHVQACLGDRCSTNSLSPLISIEPAFYETRLFLFAVICALGLAAFGLHRMRVRTLTAREQRLRALVEERTSELRDSRDQLRTSHEQLEVRVVNRTKELSAANHQLESEIAVRREAELKAEAASHAKSEFLTNMSHELRTPINGIMGMTDILLSTAENPEQTEFLGIVKASADSLLHIVNDILDFSSIEARKLHIVPVRFSLVHCFEQLRRLFAPRAQDKGLQLSISQLPQQLDQLVGDPDRLNQILFNLLDNAIKFTPTGSVSLTLDIEERTPRGLRLRFAVSDTGIGIEQEKLHMIFQAFSQADYSSTRKYGGTGLGLTIASHLVQLMEGELSVRSEAGRGTTFTFTAHFGVFSAPIDLHSDVAGSELICT